MGNTINGEYSVPASGMARAPAAKVLRARRRSAIGVARGLSSALLATLLSALIVAADHLVDAWSGGSLTLALLVLWLVAFAGLYLFSGTTWRLAMRMVTGFQAWSKRVAREDADDHVMGLPRSDERVAADVNENRPW